MWIEIAEKYAFVAKGVAYPLLGHYKSYNDNENFLRIAKIAFSKWPAELDYYLISTIDKKLYPEFYAEVLKFFAFDKESIDSYVELKDYYDLEQRKEILKEAEGKWSTKFIVLLLENEVLYPEILRIVKNEDTDNILDLIAPILNVYPDECYQILKQKCGATLEELEKNCSTYQVIVSYINQMKRIGAKIQDVNLYINELQNMPIPKLKEELKKGNII